MGLRLSIDQWAFWSPSGSDPRDWRISRPAGSAMLKSEDVPGDLIPTMHRRRMSTGCKTGVYTALKIDGDVSIDYAVFASQHGEVERSQTLIDQLANHSELSPTDFSLSVHNTAAGMYSIIKGSTLPSTSIASGASSFASGWLEAEAYLHENRTGRVLLVNHDGSLPELYREYLNFEHSPFALALLVRLADAGNGVTLEVAPTAQSDNVPIGPEFLRWWLSPQKSIKLKAESQSFEWSR